jgi:hypothetical protein
VFPQNLRWGARGRKNRKLSGEKLSVLLRELRSYLDELPDHVDEVHKVQQRVTAATALLLEDDMEGDESAQIADEFGNWLIDYFQSVFFSLSSFTREIISADELMRKV